MAAGIKIIAKNRNRRLSGRGGGVCFAFRTGVSNFKEKKLKNAAKFELLCVVGTAGAIKRKIVVFTLYIPPRMKAADVEELTEILATGITEVKLAHGNPIIIVCGDFNGKHIHDAFAVDDDIALVQTGPTRGDNTLDLVFTNALGEVTEAVVLDPLEAEDGKTSDHRCVAISTKFPKTRDFQWIKKTARKRSDEADGGFVKDLLKFGWRDGCDRSPDELLGEFNAEIARLTDKHFPLVTIRKRSNEKPWITNGIRRRAKKKKMIYREQGRSQAWRRADARLQAEINLKKQEFVEEVLEAPPRNYYEAVKQLSGHDPKKTWDVLQLFPENSPAEAGEKILDFFSSVGGDKQASCPPRIPGHDDAGLGFFDRARVELLLSRHKKTKSMVDGDPLPHLIQKFPHAFAGPVADIFNSVNKDVIAQTFPSRHMLRIPWAEARTLTGAMREVPITSVIQF